MADRHAADEAPRRAGWPPGTSLKPQLDRTWQFIEAIERTRSAAEVEDCLIALAAGFGFTTIFGGIVPPQRLPPAEIASRTLFQRFPLEWAVQQQGISLS